MFFIESSAAPPNDSNKSIKLLPLSLLLAIPFTIILIITVLSTLIYRYVTRRQPEEINPEQESSSESKEDNILLNNIIDVYNPEDTDLSSNSLVDRRELDYISIVTYRSYAPSNVDFEMEEQDDIAGFQQHKWKKLNATTAV